MRYPTPAEWLDLLEEFQGSELEQKEFAAKHDVSLGTFRYWLYRRAKQVQLESKPRTKFLPVKVVASPAPKARGEVIELALSSGALVRFAIGTDARYVAEIVAALG